MLEYSKGLDQETPKFSFFLFFCIIDLIDDVLHIRLKIIMYLQECSMNPLKEIKHFTFKKHNKSSPGY